MDNFELVKQLNINFCKFKNDLPYQILGGGVEDYYKDFYESQLKLISFVDFLNDHAPTCEMFSTRLKNSLRNAKIDTVRDILSKSEYDLIMVRNFGRKSINELKTILERYNLSLAPKKLDK